jgi:hypothetical protein
MFVITLKDNPQGIYSVFDEKEQRIVPIFVEEDDADRYVIQLESDEENPELEVVETEPEQIIYACRAQGQKFSIISGDEFIIPPDAITKP